MATVLPYAVAGILLTAGIGPAQNISRIDFGGANIPAASQLNAKLDPFRTHSATDALLEKISETIVGHYQIHGRPVVIVRLDSQPDAEGTLHIEITEGRVGQATVAGGRSLNTTAWNNAAGALQGGVLDGTAVQALLDRIQRNPFAADTTLAAGPGADISEANLIYQVPDQRAWQSTLGYANDGVSPLGSSRFRLATLWGNALDTGSLVGAEISMGEDVDSYLAQSLSCTVPLAWGHEISLSAVHAATELEIIDAGEIVDVGGDAWLASLRYTIPWRSSLIWKHQIHLGLDYKQFDTDLTFGGLGTFSQPLETSAFVVGASSSFARADISTGMSLEAAWSPGGLFSNDGDADYQAIVTGADSQYLILRAGLWGKWEMPQEWTLQGRISGQWADTPLLPSEEASIGGMTAVRGYEERSILGRHAVWGAVELFAPPLPLPLTSRKPLRLLTFLDAGKAWVSAAAEPDQTALAVGIGLHMAWNGRQLRCEAAWPLHEASEHSNENRDQKMRVHISASLAF